MPDVLEDIAGWTGEERLPDLLDHYYGVKLLRAEPVRGVLKIKTDHGKFALKRVPRGDKERYRWLEEFRSHLDEDHTGPLLLPITTHFGKPYFNGYHAAYALIPWVKAQPMQWKSGEDWNRATAAIARFHYSSRGYLPSTTASRFSHIGGWRSQMENALEKCKIFHLASKWTNQPTQLDQAWLEVASYTISVIENVVEYYDRIDGDDVCLGTQKYGKVCHGNLHRHNLIEDADQRVYLLDWNKAIVSTRAYDVANWLIYAYGRTGNKEVIRSVLHQYQRKNPLDTAECSLVYSHLLYPEKLVRMLETVYDRDTPAEAQVAADAGVRQLVHIEEQKTELFKCYASILKDDFDIKIPSIDWIHRKK